MSMIGGFDFNNIVDYDNTGEVVEPAEKYIPQDEAEDNFDDNPFPFDNEEEMVEEDSFEDEEEVSEFGSTLEEVASNFDVIPEDVEFVIHGEKVSKKDIADIVHKSKELTEAYSGFTDYVSSLSEVELRVQTYLSASMTETETRLRQIEQMLEHPEQLTGGELQKAYIAQRDLRKRQTQLEENASNVRKAEEERRSQIDIIKIRQTNAALNGTVPGYKGINTLKELAGWAQQQGMDEQSLRASMSPEFIKVLMDAKLYREKIGGKRQAAERRPQKSAPAPSAQRSLSSKPKAKRSALNDHQKHRAYDAAMKAGDATAAFAFIKD